MITSIAGNTRNITIVLFLIICMVSLGFLEYKRKREAYDWVTHTLEVKGMITQLLSLIQDAETGQRGFIITGNPDYLAPYNNALSVTPIALERLRGKTTDNPKQQKYIIELNKLINEKYDELKETVRLRKTTGFADAVAIVDSNLGQNLMIEIREKIKIMQAEEDQLLISRTKKAESIKYLEGAFVLFLVIILLFIRHILLTLKREHKANHELKLANAELEEFSYRTSHDLRSPLISSIGLIEVTEESLKNGDYKTVAFSLSHLRTNLTKLEALVKDILRLAKIKGAEEEKSMIDLNGLIDTSIEKFTHMDNFERMEFRKQLQFLKPIRAKKSRMMLIIENAISNALKYQDTQEQSSYTIITSDEEKGNFILKFEDNGLGIPENQRDKIFQMFKRFHNKIGFGSGLGLYMMKQSALALEGTLVFEPPAKGSIFKLIIPLDKI